MGLNESNPFAGHHAEDDRGRAVHCGQDYARRDDSSPGHAARGRRDTGDQRPAGAAPVGWPIATNAGEPANQSSTFHFHLLFLIPLRPNPVLSLLTR